jgi:hypothetical protein
MGQIGVAFYSLSPEGRGWGEGARKLQKNLQLPNPLILSFSPNSASKTRVNALMGRRDAVRRAPSFRHAVHRSRIGVATNNEAP